LHIGATHLTNGNSKGLPQTFSSKFHKLEDLELFISSAPKLTDFEVSGLYNSIGQNTPNLKHLNFRIYGTPMLSDWTLEAISCCISSLSDLKTLKLNFSIGSLTDDGIKKLCYGLESKLSTLESLDIFFYWECKITGISLEALGTVLSKENRLKDVTISFVNCKTLGSEGFTALCQAFKTGLRNIESVELNLFGCEKITQSQFYSLVEYIGDSLLSLKYLRLKFHGQGDNKMKTLLEKIIKKKLSNLIYINLS